MKIKLDENIPLSIMPALRQRGHDADTVDQEGLKGRSDPEIWDAAQREGRFLITQDLDFSDRRRYTPASHHGLLLVRLHEPGRRALHNYLLALFAEHDPNDWARCNVIATEHKIRVRRP